jgi:hypothetical protein
MGARRAHCFCNNSPNRQGNKMKFADYRATPLPNDSETIANKTALRGAVAEFDRIR